MIVLEAQKELEDKSGHFYMQNFMTLRLVMVSGRSRAIRSLPEQKIEIFDHESPLLQTSPDPPSPSSLDPTVVDAYLNLQINHVDTEPRFTQKSVR